MTVLSISRLADGSGTGRLIQVVHKNHAGRVLRVSKYMERSGSPSPISEMIYYPNGSACLYLYDDTGEVKQVYKYDKGGLEIVYPFMGSPSKPLACVVGTR